MPVEKEIIALPESEQSAVAVLCQVAEMSRLPHVNVVAEALLSFRFRRVECQQHKTPKWSWNAESSALSLTDSCTSSRVAEIHYKLGLGLK
jgi:hypothetical protein